MILAVKCAPEEVLLSAAAKAGIKAVELYLSEDLLERDRSIVDLCSQYTFRYAVHAPNDNFQLEKFAALVKSINAEVIVFHDIYWPEEWDQIAEIFKNFEGKVCIENIFCDDEPLKFIRKYGFGACLDIEHIQLQLAGLYKEALIAAAKRASHVHMTGYAFGSQLWHTHIHHSPEHSEFILNVLKETGYSGFIVSEANKSLQNYAEFARLRNFYERWCFSSCINTGVSGKDRLD